MLLNTEMLTQANGNQVVELVLIGASVLLVMAIAVLAFFFFSRKRVVSAELAQANQEITHQKQMLQATIITQENERKRIAQDLHDAISSKLNIVSLNTNVLLEEQSDRSETKKLLTTILDISNSTLDSSRQIAHDLLPPVLQKFGLWAALEELKMNFNQAHKDLVTLTGDYAQDKIPAKDELHLFRIVQELINNSLRHGKASKITVHLNSEPLSLNYTDNGIGLKKTPKQGKAGLGLKNIESRVEILGGKSAMESAQTGGIIFNFKKIIED